MHAPMLRHSGRLVRPVLSSLVLCAAAAIGLAEAQAKAAKRSRPPAAFDVTEATIPELQAAMASGRTSSVGLVQAYLARIAAYDQAGPKINSLIRINRRAMRDAAALDAERKAGKVRGPLHGVPIILKDNFDTHDMPTSAGALALANSRPTRDAFVVARLREAGAVVLAKANMHELATHIVTFSSLGGQTRNPYDPTRCPGGSSGGTGAAIAASFAAVGWGSDTCGSIRIPSAFNALVGLRPTQGLISRRGIVPLSHAMDIGGPMARTVTDLAIALDASVGHDPEDESTRVLAEREPPRFEAALDRQALQGARIGIFLPLFKDTNDEVADTVRAALTAMKALGATVIEVPLADYDSLVARTGHNELKFEFSDYMRTIPNAPVSSLRDMLDRGLHDRGQEHTYLYADTVSTPLGPSQQEAVARRAVLSARLERLLDSLSLDALAYPTIRQKPALVGESQPGSSCAAAARTGLPALSLPAGIGLDGLPIGLELLGKRFDDARLVAMAYAFEQAGPRRRVPTTTPRLVRGVAPTAPTVRVRVQRADVGVVTRVTVDPVRNELRWSATVERGAKHLTALVLRRRGAAVYTTAPTRDTVPRTSLAVPASATRVVLRMLGPEMTRASGTLPLQYADRQAFEEGRLTVAMYTATANEPVERAVRGAGCVAASGEVAVAGGSAARCRDDVTPQRIGR